MGQPGAPLALKEASGAGATLFQTWICRPLTAYECASVAMRIVEHGHAGLGVDAVQPLVRDAPCRPVPQPSLLLPFLQKCGGCTAAAAAAAPAPALGGRLCWRRRGCGCGRVVVSDHGDGDYAVHGDPRRVHRGLGLAESDGICDVFSKTRSSQNKKSGECGEHGIHKTCSEMQRASRLRLPPL